MITFVLLSGKKIPQRHTKETQRITKGKTDSVFNSIIQYEKVSLISGDFLLYCNLSDICTERKYGNS